jgi:magnesium chelatase family protein
LRAIPVDVEVSVREGKPHFQIVGMADGVIRESRERVASALRHSGIKLIHQVLVNLAPAEIKKEGAIFDVAIALGIAVALKVLRQDALKGRSVHGELSLDGTIRPIRGAILMAVSAVEQGLTEVIVPVENVAEVELIEGIQVTGVKRLTDLISYLRNSSSMESPRITRPHGNTRTVDLSRLNDVIGQDRVKRAMAVAAAGGHNLLMIGPPGCGKSMLAERFNLLLPPPTEKEMLEIVSIHSIAGLPVEQYLVGERPMRSPHHGISDVGLVGGGSPIRPGEISLAHRGVLFLDELPEFKRTCIESLRSPLEQGTVHISRSRGSVIYPARFQLIAAMNPCPCGRLGAQINPCTCSQHSIQHYLKRLSQPIVERIDIHVAVEAVAVHDLIHKTHPTLPSLKPHDMSATVLRILEARERQILRSGVCNADLSSTDLLSAICCTTTARSLLETAARKIGISARGFMKTLRVARSIADIESSSDVTESHIAEALSYRELHRLYSYAGVQNPNGQ